MYEVRHYKRDDAKNADGGFLFHAGMLTLES